MRNVTSNEFCIFNGHTYVLSSGADFCVAAKLIHLPLQSSTLAWHPACPYDVHLRGLSSRDTGVAVVFATHLINCPRASIVSDDRLEAGERACPDVAVSSAK